MIDPDKRLSDEEFINRYINDYTNFEKLGIPKDTIFSMLSLLEYVHIQIHTPEWLKCVKSLPKGTKWADGRKFQKKAGKKGESKTYVFLAIDNDLYIKDLLHRAYAILDERDEINPKTGLNDRVYVRIADRRICVIKDYKKLVSHEVVLGLLDISTPFLENCIHQFWKESGLFCGLHVRILKDV